MNRRRLGACIPGPLAESNTTSEFWTGPKWLSEGVALEGSSRENRQALLEHISGKIHVLSDRKVLVACPQGHPMFYTSKSLKAAKCRECGATLTGEEYLDALGRFDVRRMLHKMNIPTKQPKQKSKR